MNALMLPVEEFFRCAPSETEDFEHLWGDEEFVSELMEAISNNFVREVEASRMPAWPKLNGG
jgi:hypothetical protein